ncbi:hypothetical protein FQZ97_888630 [compost metagenome]
MRAIDLDHGPPGRIRRHARRRQLAAPDAARIQRHQVRPHHQAQRRPVPAHHGHIPGAPPRHIEPRHKAVRRLAEPFLGLEVHHAIDGAIAQSGKGIDHHTMAFDAAQAVVPAVGGIAEDVGQEALPVRALELGFDFLSEVDDLGGRPLGEDAGVDLQEVVFQQGQRAVAQPGEQVLTIGRGEDVVQGVGLALLADAAGYCKEVDVVVAEDGFGPGSHGMDGA